MNYRYLERNSLEELVSLDGLALDKDLQNYEEILQTNLRKLLSEHLIDGKKRSEVETRTLYVTTKGLPLRILKMLVRMKFWKESHTNYSSFLMRR